MIGKHVIGMTAGIVCGLFPPSSLGHGAGIAQPAQAASYADPTQDRCSRAQEAADKRIVMRSLTAPQDYYDLMHPDYVQHNPDALRFEEINHLKGRDAMTRLLEVMGRLGTHGPPPSFLAKRSIMVAECDLVMVLRQVELPDPQSPGKDYTSFGFEMFRIKDGKLYEHWDDTRIADPPPAYLTSPVKNLQLQK